MKTDNEIKAIIARQTPENKPELVTIEETDYREEEGVTIVTFLYDEYLLLYAVIYDDETCFTPRDWQHMFDFDLSFDDEVEETDWYNHELGRTGIVLGGLPRMF